MFVIIIIIIIIINIIIIVSLKCSLRANTPGHWVYMLKNIRENLDVYLIIEICL